MCGLDSKRIARLLLTPALMIAVLPALIGCDARSAQANPSGGQRVLVLGVDGMDPVILRGLMNSGRMPNFSRIAAAGTFTELATSMPPQSPVAWSNFISGASPATHQIYDFIHRDPNPDVPGMAILPYLSTSRTLAPENERVISLGEWRIPLSSGRTELLRRGGAFWDELTAHGVETTIYRVPANYPPPAVEGSAPCICLCGMGTPDILGTYGEFTCFTPSAPEGGRNVGGGRFVHLEVREHHATAALEGPANFLRMPDPKTGAPRMQVRLDIVRDPQANVAKITIGGDTLLLNEGEWSDWVRIEFKTGIPGGSLLSGVGYPTSVRAMVRLLLKQVHPDLELYVSPLNIDPTAPATPISTPSDFSKQLAEACGLHYTTGIPEDAKALRTGGLNEDQFLQQVQLLVEERLRQYRYALDNFHSGFLFFYFGHTDQIAHMFWRDRDPGHPGRIEAEATRYGTVIEDTYVEMDKLVGETLGHLDEDDTLIILSDHGFTTFRRGFNLNTWLLRNGYLSVFGSPNDGRRMRLRDVDWSQTRAYAIGLNSLYVNLRGRERQGIVDPDERAALMAELGEKLVAVRDADGQQVIEKVYFVDKYYPGADPQVAPDLLIGYARTYRASWATSLGGIAPDLLEDNHDRWCGTHLIAHYLVPGILVTNRKVALDDPALTDMGPSILSLFGIEKPAGMTGRPAFTNDGPVAITGTEPPRRENENGQDQD